jgi:hypothetical protein
VAARRLIAVMLVLLFLSSLAAALAPVERSSEDTSTTTTDTLTDPVADQGDLVRKRLAASTKDPGRVEVGVGDQLQLRVTSQRPMTIELRRLGPVEDVDPAAPALFDLLLDEEGRYPLRELASGRLVGTISVTPRAPTEPARGEARSRS